VNFPYSVTAADNPLMLPLQGTDRWYQMIDEYYTMEMGIVQQALYFLVCCLAQSTSLLCLDVVSSLGLLPWWSLGVARVCTKGRQCLVFSLLPSPVYLPTLPGRRL
jgi:hypothetical protein